MHGVVYIYIKKESFYPLKDYVTLLCICICNMCNVYILYTRFNKKNIFCHADIYITRKKCLPFERNTSIYNSV